MHRSLVLLVGALVVFCSWSAAHACSCAGPNPICSVYFGTPTIFRGVVIEKVLERPPIHTLIDADGHTAQLISPGQFRVTFAVSESFRGGSQSGQLTVYTSEQGSACGFPFQMDSEYIVFAKQNRAGDQLWTSHCSLTHAVVDLAADSAVQWMRQLASAPEGSRLYGSIHLDQAEKAPQATITVRGPANLDVRTDSAGSYDLKSLPPGRYTVAASLPAGLTAGPQNTVTLENKGCAQVDWYASYDAHVRGRVAEIGGKPVAHAYMQLQRRDANMANSLTTVTSATTADDGSYDFAFVPPGEYLILANVFGLTPDMPYPKVYFPTSPTASGATSVQVRPSQSLNDINVEMPRAMKKVNVTTNVVLENGTPAAGVTVDANQVTDRFTIFPMTAVTGPDGTATLPVYEGLEYYATALRNGMPQHCAGPLQFTAKAGINIGTLRIEHPWGNCLAQLGPRFSPPR